MTSLALEDFARPSAAVHAPPPDASPRAETLAEAERVAAWEQGYKAGWDDAVRAETEGQERIGADLARSLQEISFTFHEARAQVTEALQPLLEQITATLLPGLATEALAATLRDALWAGAAPAGDGPLDLVLAPGSRPAVERHLSGSLPGNMRLVEEPSLGPGQAYLRLGSAETEIDIDAALARMRQAVQDVFTPELREARNG